MITRLYVDNFKTLVNFELHLGPMNLLLGENGSGKSTVMEAIGLLRTFVVSGEKCVSVFTPDSLCRWDTRKGQIFEIDLLDLEGKYTYRLEIEHDASRERCYVKTEQLTHNQQPVFVSDAVTARVYDSDGVGKGFPVYRDRSGVGLLNADASQWLLRFKRRLRMTWSLRLNPDAMAVECHTESTHPRRDAANFASWYRHLTLDQPSRVFELTETLRNNVLDGFRSLRLKAVGERSRALWAEFTANTLEGQEATTEYRFDELSDGQRILIVLYALLICAGDEGNTLCLDHPETYLALPEIQPWLMRLADATEEGRCQAVIATHHPELINLLAASSGYWLERQSGGPTRVKRIGDQDSSGLPVSELIARGWLHG